MLAVAAVSFAAPVLAQSSANRTAYAASLKCFVANGNAAGQRRDVGDAAGVRRYEAQATTAWQTSIRLGRQLSYSDAQMQADRARALDQELPRMFRDEAYFRETVATCRGLGLM